MVSESVLCPVNMMMGALKPLSTAIGSNSSCSASCSTSASRSSESSSTIRILRVFVIPRPQDRHHPGTAFARNRAFGGKRTSRFAIYNDKLELGGLQDRQIGGLLALENPTDVDAGLAICTRN